MASVDRSKASEAKTASSFDQYATRASGSMRALAVLSGVQPCAATKSSVTTYFMAMFPDCIAHRRCYVTHLRLNAMRKHPARKIDKSVSTFIRLLLISLVTKVSFCTFPPGVRARTKDLNASSGTLSMPVLIIFLSSCNRSFVIFAAAWDCSTLRSFHPIV